MNVHEPVLEWHHLFSSNLVKSSPESKKLFLNQHDFAMHGFFGIAGIHELLMPLPKNKTERQHRMSIAALNLMLNGLCDGVDKYLNRAPSQEARDSIAQMNGRSNRKASQPGIFNFEASPQHVQRHQDDKKDILMATDLWCCQRIFDAIFLLTARHQQDDSLALDIELFNAYMLDPDVELRSQVKSLPDTILHRIVHPATWRHSTKKWYKEDIRYTRSYKLEDDNGKYSTKYVQKLIEAYRIINKNLTKWRDAFGLHSSNHTAAKGVNYDASATIEIYELLDFVVQCADAEDQMHHAIGFGTDPQQQEMTSTK